MTQFYAVFGDIHGRVALMMTLSRLWEQQTKTTLSGILQVGDMGAYPDHSRLDSATLRHAKRDPDELTYVNFISETDEYKTFFGLSETRVVFVRGNHEDFDYLGQFRSPTPVDPWGRMTYVPDRQCYELKSNKGALKIASFGGIAPRSEDENPRGRRARNAHRKHRQKSEKDPRFFTKKDAETAFLGVRDVDVLMTHAGPEMPDFKSGSRLLRSLCNRLAPRVHLFGHHHRIYGPELGPAGELLVGLEHLDFNRRGELAMGCWGILEVDEERVDFHFGDADCYDWVTWVRRESYRQLVTTFEGEETLKPL